MPIYFKPDNSPERFAARQRVQEIMIKMVAISKRPFLAAHNQFALQLEQKQRDNEVYKLIVELRKMVTDSAIILVNPQVKFIRVVKEGFFDITLPLENWPMFNDYYMVGNLPNQCLYIYGNETFKID